MNGHTLRANKLRSQTHYLESEVINQINYIIDKLSKTSYTRRAQAITWNVGSDPQTYDAPCLQRIWFRMLENENKELVLNMNTNWRSRDGYKAAFMNIFALTDLQRIVAEKISKNINKKVLLGRYTDIADSFHIYGSYYKEFESFVKTVQKRSFEERTWDSEYAEPIFEEAREKLKAELPLDRFITIEARQIAALLYGADLSGEEAPEHKLLSLIEDEGAKRFLTTALLGESPANPEEILGDCIESLKGEHLKERVNAIKSELRQAEASGDTAKASELISALKAEIS